MAYKKIYRIDGYLISNVRRNCKFIFGNFFVKAHVNTELRIYEIRIRKTLKVRCEDSELGYKIEKIEDYVDLKHFKDFWGPCWRLIEHKEDEL